jgi:hypothetical protein
MTYPTTEVTNLFYTIARGWISQTNSSVSGQFENTKSFNNLGGEILSSIHEKLGDEIFTKGQDQLAVVSDEYRVSPAVRGPEKLTTQEIGQIAYMASSHFFSALGRAFTLEPTDFLAFFGAVSKTMEDYYNAEMIAATTNK